MDILQDTSTGTIFTTINPSNNFQVVLDLFAVGFVCEATRETACKNCRDLLSELASRHPFVLSYLLQLVRLQLGQLGGLAAYLFAELPWSIWWPTEADMTVVVGWLQSPAQALENGLSRTVLASMNWELGVLAAELHVSVALAVLEALLRLDSTASAAAAASGGLVNSSMVTMTHLAMVTMTSLGALATATAEQQLSRWGWEQLSRLHLHLLDQSPALYANVLAGKSAAFATLMDFDLSPQIQSIVAAAVGRQPAACYATLLLTQVGHALPELLERGLPLLKTVLDAGRLDHAIELLLHVLPISLADPSALWENTHLAEILQRLVTADQTYLHLARTMINRKFPGPATKELENMLEKLIANFSDSGPGAGSGYGKADLLMLLLGLLVRVPGWNQNRSCLHLVNMLCAHAFTDTNAKPRVQAFFEGLHTALQHQSAGGGAAGGLLSLLASPFGSAGQHLLLSGSCPQFPWVAFFVLEAEDCLQQKSGLWRGLQLELVDHQLPLEAALTTAGKVAVMGGCPLPLSSQLAIYRWAQQALDTPPDHPLCFLYWQRFFGLYLSRPPRLDANGEEPRAVGPSFFEGMVNSMYFNKLKAGLKTSVDIFTQKRTAVSNNSGGGGGTTEEHWDQMLQLFKTYQLWLDDGKLLESRLYVPALSPAYLPERLIHLLGGQTKPWSEFLDVGRLSQEHAVAVKEWDTLHFRGYIQATNCHKAAASPPSSPVERILGRLQGYETRLPAPPLRRLAAPVPAPPVPLNSLQSLELTLAGPLNCLQELAQAHGHSVSALGCLNCSYLELVPSLWAEEEVSVYVAAACKGSMQGKERVACSGPALVQLNYTEVRTILQSVKPESNFFGWRQTVRAAPVRAPYFFNKNLDVKISGLGTAFFPVQNVPFF